jgi:alpha-1,6-mannosyltransferase
MLRSWASDHRLAAVEFRPWASDLRTEFAEAGLLLATGPRESFGLTALEALASGIPVVGPSEGGHGEVIGGLSPDLLYDAGNAASAAEALRRLFDDDRRRAFSHAAIQFAVGSYSLHEHAARVAELYESVVR